MQIEANLVHWDVEKEEPLCFTHAALRWTAYTRNISLRGMDVGTKCVDCAIKEEAAKGSDVIRSITGIEHESKD